MSSIVRDDGQHKMLFGDVHMRVESSVRRPYAYAICRSEDPGGAKAKIRLQQ